MAEFIPETEKEKVIEHVNDIADDIIDILRKLDGEYDSLVKSAEKRLESNGTRYEVKNCKNDEREYFVHDVVEQGIAICDDMQTRWEEQELSNMLLEIQGMVRDFQKEKQACLEKRALFERRINIEKKKIDSLNEIIKGSLEIGNDLRNKEEQLKSVVEELQNLSIGESIYPTAILDLHSACDQLMARLQNMEKELLQYADLPPDYDKAREKVAEAMLRDKELEREIRSVLK